MGSSCRSDRSALPWLLPRAQGGRAASRTPDATPSATDRRGAALARQATLTAGTAIRTWFARRAVSPMFRPKVEPGTLRFNCPPAPSIFLVGK